MSVFPMVSIIIPCRNEERFIARCLDSILEQDFPRERMEILVADGDSADGTAAILRGYAGRYANIRVLENAKKITPAGLNLAIRASRGDIIIRMDCHARYETNYVSRCVSHLQESGADNVGGILKTVPAAETLAAKSIARCLSHPLGAGGSRFRTGAKEPREVDTVFGGCYCREVFDRIGLFDERLIRSQDMEFNMRLKRAGGRIMLFPDIMCRYYPKSTFKEFFTHNVKDGIWAVYPLKFIRMPLRPRHYAPLAFVILLITLPFLGLLNPIFFAAWLLLTLAYVLLLGYFSLKIALEKRNARYLFSMPAAFATRHIGYGLGSLAGIVKVVM